MTNAGAAIDLSSLVLVEGKVCWDLYIDALVVSSDGNLLDSLAAAIKVAPPHFTMNISCASKVQIINLVDLYIIFFSCRLP